MSEPFDDKQAAFLRIIIEGGTWRKAREELKVGNGTISGWLQEPEFREQYARAMDIRADTIFEDILDIADDARNDWMAVHDPDNPGYRENGEAIRRSQMRIDARKWLAGKMKPKVYGDKVQTELSGSVTINHEAALDELA